MGKIYYKSHNKNNKKKIFRVLSIGLFLTGFLMVIYIFFPLISWQLYFAPAFANQSVSAPIPKNTIVSGDTLQALLSEASNSLIGADYTNAQNWFPTYKYQKTGAPTISSYTISIPKIDIKNAVVSTVDTDLTKHLVNYFGTAVPTDKGNAVIFGHSTLPQLYNEKDYKTVFTHLYKLVPGDEIVIGVGNKTVKYKIESVIVVDPDNTTVLEQNYEDSFITLITCTPPGTIWKRLIVRARIQKI